MTTPVPITPDVIIQHITATVSAVSAIPSFQGVNPKNVDEALRFLASHDARGFTPLHHAVASNNVELSRLLVSIFRLVRSPVPVLDAIDHQGRTPLHWAIQRAGDVIVSLLIEAGANVNASDSEGRSCLHYALLSSVEGDKGVAFYEDLTRYLLERGADPSAADASGAAAVHLAAELGSHGILSILVELGGASVNALDYEGENPLFYAIRENQLDIMAKLVDYGIDFSQANDSMVRFRPL
eukprot:TRINITY_DN2652_c0_g1_i3.p1 TRINITY_DN2652_c0_g1~~TRINITY_DN2652_c0_g1_i3.p1  ORF type:complete len:240 (-),score=47.51 TRINITY_DN2652_c0_g1_i3:32-751(-)